MNTFLSRCFFSVRKGTSLFLLASIILLLSACNRSPINLSGNITGVKSDTLLVFIHQMDSRQRIGTDTVALKENHFELQVPDSDLFIFITAKPATPEEALRMPQKPILFFPGNKIEVNGPIDDLIYSGSQLYKELALLDDVNKAEKDMDKLNAEFLNKYREGDKEAMKKIKAACKEQYDRLLKTKMDAIKNNPNSQASAYLSTGLKAEFGLEAIHLLSEEVKNGPMKNLIESTQIRYEKSIARHKAEESIKAGKPAPDLKLKTIDGKDITLDSFKGKYLLLDFWGSWCGWCIKGMPEMKKYYAKYNKKVEFLGIACNDTEKKWRDAVAKHQLPWINAMEGNSDATVKYAVGGFPTKILIDPEGKIVEVFVGETPELYKKMDELFK